jgi:hypothetical protein
MNHETIKRHVLSVTADLVRYYRHAQGTPRPEETRRRDRQRRPRHALGLMVNCSPLGGWA